MIHTPFYLIRHGTKVTAAGDVPLSQTGRAQAKAVAEYFQKVPIRAILSSPLQRAKETAAYLAAELSLPVSEDLRLRERANWGDLPGQTFDQFAAMWDVCTKDRDYKPPVGDSARQAGERLSAVLMEWAEKQPDSGIIIVTHGGLITDFLVNSFAEDQLNVWHPDFIAVQSDLVSECSMTELLYDQGQGKFILKAFASTRHLEN